MKRIITKAIPIILIVSMLGCENTGYIVIINVNGIKYSHLQQIEEMLITRGFKTILKERKSDFSKYPDEVYTLFEKKIGDKPYYFVDVYVNYPKDVPNSFARYLRIEISNVYKGMTIPEIKEDIDYTGNLIYRELVDRVGKDNIIIERRGENLSGFFRR